MGHAFGSVDELGEGYGFRKVRVPLGVTAFGVNAIVYPPGYEGFHHYHDTQDELYFVHAGSARIEIDGEERVLGPGGLCHVESTTPRKVSNASETDDLVMLVVGGKGGYVERDGHMVDDADVERRASFGNQARRGEARLALAACRATRRSPLCRADGRLVTERGDRLPEAVLERDLRLPAEQLLRARDVRLALLRVVHR